VLAQAENNELMINRQPLNSLNIIQQIASELQLLEVAKGKAIIVSENSVNESFESDPVLLRRVLNNMVKNALEASKPGQAVTMAVTKIDQKLKFSVHNTNFIPHHIEMQVFMRSFSTKGTQRGLGTYSMKILGEQHLGETVDFTTTASEGTTFFIIL
jgi:signal transduction histidine kinase